MNASYQFWQMEADLFELSGKRKHAYEPLVELPSSRVKTESFGLSFGGLATEPKSI